MVSSLGGGIPVNEIATCPKKHFSGGGNDWAFAFDLFGIKPREIRSLGLRKIKSRAKHTYRKLMFEMHPDSKGRRWIYLYSKGRVPWNLEKVRKAHQKIQNLRYLPIGKEDADYGAILTLEKGFKSTADVDFGLNSHLAENYGKQCNF